MEITLDKFGRVVIPKRLRERLGLGPGAVLEIEPGNGEDLLLRPRRPEPDLVEERGVLVFTGEPTEALERAVEKLREGRIRDLAGWTEG